MFTMGLLPLLLLTPEVHNSNLVWDIHYPD
jgi:hypothetical protein